MRRIWNDETGKHVARGTASLGVAMLGHNLNEAAGWAWLFERKR